MRYAERDPFAAGDAGIVERAGQHPVGLAGRREGVVVRTALHHETDLDHDVAVVPGPLHRLQVAHVVHLAFAGDQELVVGRQATLVLDVGVGAVRRQLRDDRLHRHPLHIEVADVEVDRQTG